MRGSLRLVVAVLTLLVLVVTGCNASAEADLDATPTLAADATASTADPALASARGSDCDCEPADIGTASMIEDGAFGPALELRTGELVTWVNRDGVTHQIASDDGSIESGEIGPNESFAHEFHEAGSFSIYCTVHEDMRMDVVVE